MKCPKCKNEIAENVKVCPHCHKVLVLTCPNCGSDVEGSTCEKCGYIVLSKCAKCKRTISSVQTKCKCGFPVASTIAIQECETDEFASIVIKFNALKNIRKTLGSQDLFTKFYFKLKNLLTSQIKNQEGRVIQYNDVFVVNMNKELSFPTSVNKAVRLALKICNVFSSLNLKVQEELATSLNLSIFIVKKRAEDLLLFNDIESNIKLLNSKSNMPKYLRGFQIILDESSRDIINKEFKTDSLFNLEINNKNVMFYELLIDNYILPPVEIEQEEKILTTKKDIKKVEIKSEEDIYKFKVFDINAKCKFKRIEGHKLFENLDDSKIFSIRTTQDSTVKTFDIYNYFVNQGKNVIQAVCTEALAYKPWGVFEQIFKEYFKLSMHNSFVDPNLDLKRFNKLLNLYRENVRKSSSPEDARFAYMEDFETLLKSMSNAVVIVDGFEFMDDSTIQTLDLYFNKCKNINVTFVFITNMEVSLHSKFKKLLKTDLYTEITLLKSDINALLHTIKEDATDFIKSFYFEKIQEFYNGSAIYFDNVIKFLKEKNILMTFENKLIVQNEKTVIIPSNLKELYKARLKIINKNMDMSLILAYSNYLGPRLDFALLEKLGVKDLINSVRALEEKGFVYVHDEFVYVNNYNLLVEVIQSSIKPNTNEFLCKNILANIGQGLDTTTTLLIMGKMSMFKEECMLLWKNSQFALKCGDFDAYLKNCFGYLSLIQQVNENLSVEDFENNKKEIFQNILINLYNYSPNKIIDIENILLIEALNKQDMETIVKLSNLLLQGSLIVANYSDAMRHLHTILSNMANPCLMVDGAVNTKFLLLSLVNIEILYNIGEYKECVMVANNILEVLKPEIIDMVKPVSFSTNFFIGHLLETFRLVGFAKVFLLDDDLEDFFSKIETSLGARLPEEKCIIAFEQFLSGKKFVASNSENATPYSKILYLIMQEFEEHKENYKEFAQNIYQAKLLASDLHITQLEFFCDLMIAYAYSKMGMLDKANIIYLDVLKHAEKSAIFNIIVISKYLFALLELERNNIDAALVIVNDMLSFIHEQDNQAKPFLVLFKKLFVGIVEKYKVNSIDIELDKQIISQYIQDGKMNRLLS